jgi:polar amino acid transport system substrate-binding protein
MIRTLTLCLLSLGLSLSIDAAAQDKTIHLTSLDWPPYSGASLSEQGASVAVARAAAKAMGYELKVQFLPWARAVALAADPASGVVGYFPEYHSSDVAERFLLSDPIGSGPLGLAEQRAAPVAWSSLADLKPHTIGTVRDYVNTEEFDRMAAAGELKVEAVNDDATNLRKVAAGRLPLAVIDRHVMGYLLANDAALKSDADKLQFNARLLEDKQLYIAFQRSPQGEAAARVINEGLKKIDVAAVAAPFFQ